MDSSWQLRVGLFFMIAALVVGALPLFKAKPVPAEPPPSRPTLVAVVATVAKPAPAPAPPAKPAKRRGGRH